MQNNLSKKECLFFIKLYLGVKNLTELLTRQCYRLAKPYCNHDFVFLGRE